MVMVQLPEQSVVECFEVFLTWDQVDDEGEVIEGNEVIIFIKAGMGAS